MTRHKRNVARPKQIPRQPQFEEDTGTDNPLSFYVGVVVYLGCCAFAFKNVHSAQPEPYLDEVFHVPQTQKFCNGTFNQWDPKITTLPGTYLISAAMVKMVAMFGFGGSDEDDGGCPTFFLRLFNFMIGIQNFQLIRGILEFYMKGENEWKIILAAVNVSMFPVLFFFNFLFYTDVTSTFWLLLMHLLFIKKSFWSSAICGALSILTRQTNVVWVAFHCMIMVFGKLEQLMKTRSAAPTTEVIDTNKKSRPRKASHNLAGHSQEQSGSAAKKISWKTLMDLADLGKMGGYIIIIMGFIAFVIWNGGIVVGDKEAHSVTLNFPQIGYFTLVFGLFAGPYIGCRLSSTVYNVINNKKWIFLGTLVAVGAVHFNTVAHPYLLADNRHYPFYFWKNIIQTFPWGRYSLIPNYVLIWTFIFGNSPGDKFPHYSLALFISAVVQLVPQLLLEFRYFIPVYLMARLAIPKPSWLELVSEFCVTLVVNIATLQLFVNRPFSWPDHPDELQRFMW